MINRNESFGNKKLSILDRLIYSLRTKQIKKYCDFNNKIIADVGCGYNAYFLEYIKNKFKPNKLIAFDIKLNKDFLLENNITVLEGDLNKEFTLGEKVDLILGTAILEHLSNPIGFLKTSYDNLKDGGLLVLTVPSIWSKPVLEFIAYRLKLISPIEIEDHKEYYTKKKLLNYLQEAGFKIENIKHDYFELYMNNFVLVKK